VPSNRSSPEFDWGVSCLEGPPQAERRIEISATVSEAVADAFEKQKALPKEGSLVVLREVAGARYVSRYHRTRIRETSQLLS
jgi:hypothetical protein